MRAVVQRVSEASVSVAGALVAKTGPGLVVLLGISRHDAAPEADYLADKVAHLRVFPDENGVMNRSVLEKRGDILVVSQFTLYGDARKGRRPSYIDAAPPEEAISLYRHFVERLKTTGLRVEEGVFQAMMDVGLVNQGPVTILLDSSRGF